MLPATQEEIGLVERSRRLPSNRRKVQGGATCVRQRHPVFIALDV